MRQVNSLADVNIVLRELLDWKAQMQTKSQDQSGLQIKNLGKATDPGDAVTLAQVQEMIDKAVRKALA